MRKNQDDKEVAFAIVVDKENNLEKEYGRTKNNGEKRIICIKFYNSHLRNHDAVCITCKAGKWLLCPIAGLPVGHLLLDRLPANFDANW